MADGDVWISKFFSDSTYVRGGKVDWDAPGWRDVKEKRQPPPETLPLPVYADEKYETYETLPPVFVGGGGGVSVCAAMADVFRRFDLVEAGLGKGGVFPVQLYLHDRVTPVRADYSVLVYGGNKDGLIPEESQGLRTGKYAPKPPTSWMVSEPKDGEIAVSATVRSGSDVWFDQKLSNAVFLSGRLVQALKEAGFAKHFKPIRCRVVEPL